MPRKLSRTYILVGLTCLVSLLVGIGLARLASQNQNQDMNLEVSQLGTGLEYLTSLGIFELAVIFILLAWVWLDTRQEARLEELISAQNAELSILAALLTKALVYKPPERLYSPTSLIYTTPPHDQTAKPATKTGKHL